MLIRGFRYKNGVLEIIMPAPKQMASKKVQIDVK
jgi:HSP20 family molecular chaperone IbpA